jgi:hypothetical protein
MSLNYFVSFASVRVGVCSFALIIRMIYLVCEIDLLEKNKVGEHIGILNLNYLSLITLN